MSFSLELPVAQSTRWQPLRAGIHNLWEYDDQRFLFHKGRLLLRGRNESGKTKALEVLLPFLLDADLSPQRLDPFGSTARPMRWNLINENNTDVKVAIGYTWLEFGRIPERGDSSKGDIKKRENGETLTIGAGVRAKRANTAVDVWYFITTNRIDRDIHLLQKGRALLSRNRLIEKLGDAGRVYTKKGDYRRDLNGRLFGMSSDQYSALVEALLQLRRPQLSKQLRPNELAKILTASLPPLDARKIGPLGEGFERLDRHHSGREQLYSCLTTIQSFVSIYRQHIEGVGRRKANEVIEGEKLYIKSKKALQEKKAAYEQAHKLQQQLAHETENLETTLEETTERIQTLRTSDEYRAIKDLDSAKKKRRPIRKTTLTHSITPGKGDPISSYSRRDAERGTLGSSCATRKSRFPAHHCKKSSREDSPWAPSPIHRQTDRGRDAGSGASHLFCSSG